MIFKREGSPFYSYRFMFHGEVYQASTKQGNFKVAKEIETTRRSEVSRGKCAIFDKRPSPTLADFCTNEFEPKISATVGGPIRKKTWDDFYKVGVKALRGYPQLANARLDEINSDLIGRFAAERRKNGKAISTVNSSLRVLCRILNKAVEWTKPEKGVFFLEKAPEIKLLKGENRRERVLTSKEESAYLEKAKPGSLLGDFVAVLFDTALRPEEAYRLRWEDIAWEDGLHGDSTLRVCHGKTDNARRDLPMSPRVRALLVFKWERAGKPKEGWLWPAPTASGHMEPSTVKKRHARACVESGIKPFVLYDVRHTSLTRLGCSGCDTWTFARIAGHGSITMSTRYVHSQHMENAGWWGQWFANRNARQLSSQLEATTLQPPPDRAAGSDEFRYTRN